MCRTLNFLALCIACCLGPTGAQGGDAPAGLKPVLLSTSEWPPYTGQALPGLGASSDIVRQAFRRAGYAVDIRFYPFKRAVAVAADDPSFAGYMTEYDDPEVQKRFVYSAAIGSSPLGFAENTASPVPWTTLDDLVGRRIGVVNGYVNTLGFDAMMRAGRLQTEGVDLDETNLRKLGARHLDLAVIDANVLDFLLTTSLRGQPVRMNPHMLEDKKLYIAFRRDPRIDPIRQDFDKAMAGTDPVAYQQDYMRKLSGP
jgi:polar amino acid transport system substrate-binding protein